MFVLLSVQGMRNRSTFLSEVLYLNFAIDTSKEKQTWDSSFLASERDFSQGVRKVHKVNIWYAIFK
jgi:hypothetical protein